MWPVFIKDVMHIDENGTDILYLLPVLTIGTCDVSEFDSLDAIESIYLLRILNECL